MTSRSPKAIQQALDHREDGLEALRDLAREAVESEAPDARVQVFGLANALWETIAQAAWNEGNRSTAVLDRGSEIRDLCRWTIEFSVNEDDELFDLAGAQMVLAMVEHVSGNSALSIELLASATNRGTDQYFWESASEKHARILIDLNRLDEALAKLREIQAAHPDNAFARNCLEAYEADQSSEAAKLEARAGLESILEPGEELTPAHIPAITERIGQQFQADMAELMAMDLSTEERMKMMSAAQEEFMAVMQQMSELQCG